MYRLIVIGVILIAFPVIAHTQPNKSTEQLLISYEHQSWEAVKQRDYEKFGRMLADDFSDIFSNGQVVTKPELLQTYIRGVELLEYSLSKFRVVMLNRNAAIVVYEAMARGSESQSLAHDIKKGEVTAIHVAVTSGWAKRKGKWRNVFYRENDVK